MTPGHTPEPHAHAFAWESAPIIYLPRKLLIPKYEPEPLHLVLMAVWFPPSPRPFPLRVCPSVVLPGITRSPRWAGAGAGRGGCAGTGPRSARCGGRGGGRALASQPTGQEWALLLLLLLLLLLVILLLLLLLLLLLYYF